jgi:N-acylglucosamine 2-epimerase
MDQSATIILANENQSCSHFASLYREELVNNILSFWCRNSADEKYGGYFTCLNRNGEVYDTDKFIWLQGRQVWTFSTMYQLVERREEWKDVALSGAKFLEKNGRDDKGHWYFSLNRSGQPLTHAVNIFSDCFAAMGFSALYKIIPNEEYRQIAEDTFNQILIRQSDWKGQYNKNYPGTRPMKNFTLPMILCNLALEMEHILGSEKVNELLPGVVNQVMNVFYRPEFGLILENIGIDNNPIDSFEGRLLNPGHAIEAMWFIMDIGNRINDHGLVKRAKGIMLNTLKYAWDDKHGGLFYFMDVHQKPMQQLEWDQKLWWVHVETLVALAKAYQLTGDLECFEWFERVHIYTWEKFRDPEYGEWFGYLHRNGEPLNDAKGGKWKGCFHIPRGLFLISEVFNKMKNKY